MTGASLEVTDVTVRFAERVVLDDVDLAVGSGDTVALLGPSGSGKSTLLKVIAGIVQPAAGTVRIGGADVTGVPTHRRQVGMVFQDNQLFPHRSVIDNVAFGLQMQRIDRRVRHERAHDWLVRVGLGGFDDRDVGSLSGGEAKRVALARTMITDPLVVLLDEPLTGLDRELHDRLATDLRTLLTEAGTTALLVTHDRDEAVTMASRTVELHELGQDVPMRLHVVEIDADDTHDLRRRVLRASTPSADVVFDGDHLPSTTHLGVVSGDRLVAVSTWLQAPLPVPEPTGRPATTAVQLRGMATEPDLQGTGVGAMLLRAGVDRAGAIGAELVWARARSTALAFYLAHGFTSVGDEFVDATTGLPHVLVVRRLDTRR